MDFAEGKENWNKVACSLFLISCSQRLLIMGHPGVGHNFGRGRAFHKIQVELNPPNYASTLYPSENSSASLKFSKGQCTWSKITIQFSRCNCTELKKERKETVMVWTSERAIVFANTFSFKRFNFNYTNTYKVIKQKCSLCALCVNFAGSVIWH